MSVQAAAVPASPAAVSAAAAPLHPTVRFLGSLSKRLIILIPAAMVLGLGAGLLFDLSALQAFVLPLTMLMVYPMLVNLQLKEALHIKCAKALGLAMVLDLIVLPLVAWGLALAFFRNEPGLYVGMVLAGLFPTSGMTISWTGFAKGNVQAAVKMTVIGLILASLLAPLYLYVFARAVVPVDVLGVVRTVALVILVPLIAGVLTRTALVKRFGPQRYSQRISPVFPGISTIGVLAIVFIAIALKARMIVDDPLLVLRLAVPLVIFYGANYLIATVAGKAFVNRADAIAVVYGTVMRNLSIALGIAIASFGAEAALVLAVAYIIQVQSAAWFVKATPRVFGPAPSVEAAVPA